MKILIAGGGIGGLTCAASLLQDGFDAEVFEQATQLGEVGAGIQISANASRVYRSIGVLDRVVEAGASPDGYRFRMFDNGEVLQTIPLGQTYIDNHGVPYTTIHRADLLDILVKRVRELSPDCIHLGKRLVHFVETNDGVTLHFEDGSSATGDVLVGADGIKSKVRGQVLGVTPATYMGDASWRVIVPMASLPQEHRSNTVDIWVGPGRHSVTYPLRGGKLLNMAACVEYDQWEDESWVTPKPWTDLFNDFKDWHPTIRAVIDAADRDECYRWAMLNRPPVDNWSTERVTLIGDAAHPTLPYMAQGAAMAVEDAAVMARALRERTTVPEAVRSYQASRIGRTTRIVNESSANRELFHIGDREALKNAFGKRDMNRERNAWLFSYDPMTEPLA
ncbi:MAG: FAD-dependent monooxygenase [Variovorax sp.]